MGTCVIVMTVLNLDLTESVHTRFNSITFHHFVLLAGMSQSKVSSRYTWTRNHDGRGKSVLEGAKDTVGLSARSSVFPSHSPKLKSKNRVWRPDRPTEKSGRSQGRRLSTTKAPGPSTKGKDRPYELSLGSSATHRRRRATGLHGNRVWVPNKVATTVYVEEGASTASLLPPQRVDNARQRVLNKPCTNVDDIVVNTSGACTVTPTVSSSPVCGSVSRRVAQSTSVGKRKRRHGNLVWRPGQAGAPTVSPGRLRCTALPSKGAVLRRSRGGALHATKYHWQRKLSVGSQSPSGICYNGRFILSDGIVVQVHLHLSYLYIAEWISLPN